MTFTHPERQRFLDFLESPFFNQNKELVKFYNALLPSLQKTNPQTLHEDKVFKKTFGNIPFNTPKFHRISSDLLKQAERFLAVFKFTLNKSLLAANTLHVFNEKKLITDFPYALKYSQQLHEKSTYRDSEFYYTQFLIENEHNDYLDFVKKRSDDSNLKEVMHNLDVFYLINKLRCCCAILHYKNVNSFDTELILMEEIVHHLRAKSYQDIPVVNSYYIILLTLIESENENHFLSLKKLISNYGEQLPPIVIKEMYLYAIQYCIVKINAGLLQYYQEIFEIYQQCLEGDVLFDRGVIAPGNYKNIITVGLRLHEYKWVENFIKKYNPFLPVNEQENAYTFNMARVFFFQKKYDQVLNLLQQVEYNDVFYMLDAKLTLIKTFYELEENDSLDALLDSFTMLLRRKKLISQQYRNIYTKFAFYVKKMLRYTDKSKLKALQLEIHDAKNVADLGWLKEKIDELV